MSEKKQFWPASNFHSPTGAILELRAFYAWRMLEHFGIVTAVPGVNEDTAGRQTIRNMDPTEAVDRAFALADAFVDKVLARGELKASDDEQYAEAIIKGAEFSAAAQLKEDAIRFGSSRSESRDVLRQVRFKSKQMTDAVSELDKIRNELNRESSGVGNDESSPESPAKPE